MEEKIIQNSRNTDDDISLKDFILKLKSAYSYLLSRWVTIVLLGVMGGLLGLTYAWFNKPIYTAVTTFVLEESDKGGGLGQYAGLASMVGIDIGGGSGGGIFQGDNILELYKSRTMIEKTLLTEIVYDGKKELLVDNYIAFNKLRKDWADKPNLKNISFRKPGGIHSSVKFTRLQDSILGTIVDNINKTYLNVAKPDKKLSLIKAEVKSPNEFFAKTFNEQIVKNVNDFYIQTKTKKANDNVNILQQKTDSVRAVMNGAIYTAAAVSDATPNLNPTHQVQRIAPVQRSQFAVEANKAMLGELLKNLELSKISLRKEAPLIQVVDVPVYPLEKKKVGKLKGLVIGGMLAGFISCLILIVRKVFRMILV